MRKLTSLLLVLCLSGTLFAAPKSFSSGRSSSFSSGRSSFSSSSKQPSSSKTDKKSFSSGKPPSTTTPDKSYSGGKNTTTSVKPSHSSFDSVASKEQMKVESRSLYQKGQASKTEYKSASGQTIKIDPKDRRIEHLRGQLDNQKWVNRELRQQQFYGSYYSRPIVLYHDPYPSFFWWWLLDRSLEERALWAYHHSPRVNGMDQARYQELLSKDAQLESRIRALEAQNIPRDNTYTPKGMDPDLMYSNEYVDAAINPVEHHNDSHSSGVLKIIIWTLVFLAIAAVIYFLFFCRCFR